jgi:hypothetical protein
VGDYRIICAIEDARLLIRVVRIGNRREVYRQEAGEIPTGAAAQRASLPLP